MLTLKNIFLPLSLLLLLSWAQFHLKAKIKKPAIKISKQDSAINLNNDLISVFNLGQKRLWASYLWIITLMESDLEQYSRADLNSWMYHRFNTISILDPKFYENYRYGALYLSVVKRDVLGAKQIYDKGLRQFPNDYLLKYFAASHYLNEVGNMKKAGELYAQAAEFTQSPPLLASIAARLKAEQGNLEDAYILVKEAHDRSLEDSAIKKLYHERLYALKAEMDLTCLNRGGENCERTDQDGQAYVFDGDQYRALKEWRPFRQIKKPEN